MHLALRVSLALSVVATALLIKESVGHT